MVLRRNPNVIISQNPLPQPGLGAGWREKVVLPGSLSCLSGVWTTETGTIPWKLEHKGDLASAWRHLSKVSEGKKNLPFSFPLALQIPTLSPGLPLAGPSFKVAYNRARNGVCRSRVRDSSEDILTLHGSPDFWVEEWNWDKVQSTDFFFLGGGKG